MGRKNSLDLEKDKTKLENDESTEINSGRRRATKTIVGGVGAVAAYHLFPTKWTTPFLEQIVLPAHAQVSAAVTINSPCALSVESGGSNTATVQLLVSAYITPAVSGLSVTITVTAYRSGTPDANPIIVNTTTAADGTFGSIVTINGVGATRAVAEISVDGAEEGVRCEIPIPPKNVSTTPAPTTT